jgi:ferredoxin-like protein FixX
MKTVIYYVSDNSIHHITDEDVDITTVADHLDFCPIDFYENTESGRKLLEEYYNKVKVLSN